MDSLADVWVTCPLYQGHRCYRDTLQILFRDNSVSDGRDPEGEAEGGRIVGEGTPEDVAAVEGSYTGRALAHVLGREGVGSQFSAASNGSAVLERSGGRKLTPDPVRLATSIKLRGARQ